MVQTNTDTKQYVLSHDCHGEGYDDDDIAECEDYFNDDFLDEDVVVLDIALDCLFSK